MATPSHTTPRATVAGAALAAAFANERKRCVMESPKHSLASLSEEERRPSIDEALLAEHMASTDPHPDRCISRGGGRAQSQAPSAEEPTESQKSPRHARAATDPSKRSKFQRSATCPQGEMSSTASRRPSACSTSLGADKLASRRGSFNPAGGDGKHVHVGNTVEAMQQLTMAMTDMRAEAVEHHAAAVEDREALAQARAELDTLREECGALEDRLSAALAERPTWAQIEAREQQWREEREEHARLLRDQLQLVVERVAHASGEAQRNGEAAAGEAALAKHAVKHVSEVSEEHTRQLEAARDERDALREQIRAQRSAAAGAQEATGLALGELREMVRDGAAACEATRQESARLLAEAEGRDRDLERLRRVAARHEAQLKAVTQAVHAQRQAIDDGVKAQIVSLQLSFQRWQAELAGLPWETAEPMPRYGALPCSTGYPAATGGGGSGGVVSPTLSAPHEAAPPQRAWEGQLQALTEKMEAYEATTPRRRRSPWDRGGGGGGRRRERADDDDVDDDENCDANGGGGRDEAGVGVSAHKALMATAPRSAVAQSSAMLPCTIATPSAMASAASARGGLPSGCGHPSSTQATPQATPQMTPQATTHFGASGAAAAPPPSVPPSFRPTPAAGQQLVDELKWLESELPPRRSARPAPRPLSDGVAA